MNRTFLFGLLFVLALVGVSLLGGDHQAVAGHGCHGCSASCGCYGCSCDGCWGGPRVRYRRAYYGGCYGGCYGGGYSDCYGAGSYAPATIVTPAAPSTQQIIPVPSADDGAAQHSNRLNIRVPDGAKVIINGHETTSTGSDRQFIARGLKSGKSYRYEIRAQIDGEGDDATQTKVVTLAAGRSAELSFEFEVPSAGSVAGN